MSGRHYTAKGYCDEVDIENFLLTDIDNTFSAQIEDWIATSEAEIDKYLGYTSSTGLLSEVITNESAYGKVDNEGNLVVYTKKQPITAISAVSLYKGTSSIALTLTDSSGNAKYNISPTSEYVLFPSEELSLSGTSLITSYYELKGTKFFIHVSYTGGYATVPADIRMATVNLVADKIMRQTNKEGLASISQGRVSKRWLDRQDGESDFVKDAYKLLRPHRMTTRWF